jgi:uncharacterized iron-regulated protein
MISLSMIVATALLQPPVANPVLQPRLVDGTTGQSVSIEAVVADMKGRDVVVLGEEHDNTPGHKFFAGLVEKLHQVRPDMAISMEQFERDVQGVVTDYLCGKIDEKTFLKHSRPWKNYDPDYKPQVELAKKYNLDVIAGNIPRPLASRYVTSDNPIALFKPGTTSAPSDAYWVNFKETMKGHPPSPGGPTIEGMYRAQCAKDDAMAEGVAEYLAGRPHRRPMVVHRCGNFHCDYGLGTVSRLLQRSPLLNVGIVSMASAKDLSKPDLTKHLKKAHYLLIVPEMPKPPMPGPAKTPPAKTDAPTKTAAPQKK